MTGLGGLAETMGAIDRRLAAIMVADMEQYSRLMHEDEPGTVLAWQETREEVIKPTIASHSGNILKNTGDGFVAEFATVSGAVECSVALQSMLMGRNRDRAGGASSQFSYESILAKLLSMVMTSMAMGKYCRAT